MTSLGVARWFVRSAAARCAIPISLSLPHSLFLPPSRSPSSSLSMEPGTIIFPDSNILPARGEQKDRGEQGRQNAVEQLCKKKRQKRSHASSVAITPKMIAQKKSGKDCNIFFSWNHNKALWRMPRLQQMKSAVPSHCNSWTD